jgi:hypothetical protein
VILCHMPFSGRSRAENGPHRRAVGSVGASYSGSASKRRWAGKTLARSSRCPKRHPLDTSHRSTLQRPSRTLSTLPELPSSLPEVDRGRSSGQRSTRSSGQRPQRAWWREIDRPLGVLQGIELIGVASKQPGRKGRLRMDASSGATRDVGRSSVYFCLALQLQEVGSSLRIQGGELPGHGATRVHRDSAQKMFMRWLLAKIC